RGDAPDGAPRRGGPPGSLSRPALRRRAATGGLLPRGAERPAARARRRAHGQPRRGPRAGHPGRASRPGPRARHVGYPGNTPGRGGGGSGPRVAARSRTPRTHMTTRLLTGGETSMTWPVMRSLGWTLALGLLMAAILTPTPADAQVDERVRVFNAPGDRVWTV